MRKSSKRCLVMLTCVTMLLESQGLTVLAAEDSELSEVAVAEEAELDVKAVEADEIKVETAEIDAAEPMLMAIEEDDSDFEIKDGVLVRYLGNDKEVVIPDGVTTIGEYAFCNNDYIEIVVISNSVESIQESAFGNCSSLREVTIPQSVTYIDDMAPFDECPLEKVYVYRNSYAGKKLRQMGGYLINTHPRYMEKMYELVYVDGGFEISHSELELEVGKCARLSISGVDTDSTFRWTTEYDNVVSVYQDGTIVANKPGTEVVYAVIDGRFDSYCKVTVVQASSQQEQENPDDKSKDFYTSEDGTILYRYLGSDEYVEIPEGIVTINKNAFKEYKSIQEIIIPDTVQTINAGAFYGCSSLKEINIPDSVTFISENAFCSCSSLEKIDLPKSVVLKTGISFYGCSSLKEINIPESVTFNGKITYNGCRSLEKITIPDSVTAITKSMFEGCTRLKEITIPKSVVDIAADTFKNIPIEKIYVYKNSRADKVISRWGTYDLIYIEEVIYELNTDLLEIVKGETKTLSVKNISIDNTLAWESDDDSIASVLDDGTVTANALGEVKIYAIIDGEKGPYCTVKVISGTSEDATKDFSLSKNGKILYGYTGTDEYVVIPEGVTTIRDGAFSDNKNITKVIIPNTVTSIGNSAFCYCKSLSSVVIPDSVKNVGDYAFCGTGLTEITVNFSTIGEETFSYCRNLSKVVLTDSVETIEERAFAQCSSLYEITIPKSVKEIEHCPFWDCPLKEISVYRNSYAGHRIRKGGAGLVMYNPRDSWPTYDLIYIDGGFELYTTELELEAGGCERLSVKGADSSNTISWYSDDEKIARVYDDGTVIAEKTGTVYLYAVVDHPNPYGPEDPFSKNGKSDLMCKVTVVPASEHPGDNNKDFYISEDGTILYKYMGTEESVTIPDGVVTINEYAFKNCKEIKEVVIPNSVKTIGKDAFYGCDSLKVVNIPDSVTYIGENAFYGCNKLEAIYGVAGSGAERYAKRHSIIFISVNPSVNGPSNEEIQQIIEKNMWTKEPGEYTHEEVVQSLECLAMLQKEQLKDQATRDFFCETYRNNREAVKEQTAEVLKAFNISFEEVESIFKRVIFE
ncbi:leucine-rich repeat protein [Pseudobutyrivibrio xylanivorans]|uniref:Ig-like domain (Group 2) n=1 Tax=Pseudobutyrivibrio xylanivorans TaxID=185007 RepID=A0A1G5S0S5_PSEXY|nr:leucine-rich repeat protein [Pseudobutyrivibrio xylanivorans]SCZ79727.1 Ig-like domain (group 2) [Pseudobutyrivibrio xylanivorans]